MASLPPAGGAGGGPPGPPGMAGGGPAGAGMGGGPKPPVPGVTPSPGAQTKDGRTVVSGIVRNSSDISHALELLGKIFGPNGGDEVKQAVGLLQQGTQKFIEKYGSAVSTSPTEAGGQKSPVGGFASAMTSSTPP